MSFDVKSTEVKVRDIMNSPVITVAESASITEVAKLMREFKIGSVIVVDEDGKWKGIVTKTDIVEKVLAEEKKPEKVKVRDIMSSPLLTIEAGELVQEAAKIMRKKRISKVGVTYKGKLVGIVSIRDIIRIAPELIDIITEKSKIKSAEGINIKRKRIIGFA